MLKQLKALDAFPKIQDDFYSKTMSGGVITIVSSLIMGSLFLSELGVYLSTKTVHELQVDTTRGEMISLHFDMTFPKLPCDWISMDAIDAAGHLQLDIDHEIYKQRISNRGRPIAEVKEHQLGPNKGPLPDHLQPNTEQPAPADECGSCYGADSEPGQCCNTCEDVRAAYRAKGWMVPDYDAVEQCKREGFQDNLLAVKNEGCHIWGDLHMAKIAGKIQIMPGKTYHHEDQVIHDLQPLRTMKLDLSHDITRFAFGQPYPGQSNPLNGGKFDQQKAPGTSKKGQLGQVQYFLKVVPTSYTTLRNRTATSSYQYSVTDNFRPVDIAPAPGQQPMGPPGVFFIYDLSAIKVNSKETKVSFLTFVTSVCAIVGGVFTLSGIVDSTLYHGQRMVAKKKQIGHFE